MGPGPMEFAGSETMVHSFLLLSYIGKSAWCPTHTDFSYILRIVYRVSVSRAVDQMPTIHWISPALPV